MQNVESWKPSKFEFHKGKLRASRNYNEVSISSRLITDINARFYDINIPKYIEGNLLDLGCGKVPLYEVYKNYITKNICVDWQNSLHENIHLDYISDLNKSLPIEDNIFKSIILSDVLEHIREPYNLWLEMYRILAPGGILMMNVPFFYWLHEEPYDFFRYTKHALNYMAEKSGFEIIKLEPTGGAPEILADIAAKLTKKLPFIGAFGAKTIQKITWFFIKSNFGKRISTSTAQTFPLGYVLIAKKRDNDLNPIQKQ